MLITNPVLLASELSPLRVSNNAYDVVNFEKFQIYEEEEDHFIGFESKNNNMQLKSYIGAVTKGIVGNAANNSLDGTFDSDFSYNSNITVSLWFKLSSYGNSGSFVDGLIFLSLFNEGIHVRLKGSQLTIGLVNIMNVDLNKWYFISISLIEDVNDYNKYGTVKTYVNGSLRNTHDIYGGISKGGSAFYITSSFEAIIDEISLYTRESLSLHRTLYNSGHGVTLDY